MLGRVLDVELKREVMRALVFSDIHGNIDPIRELRAKERNEFDAIIIAGDIGNKSAVEIFKILDTFECPVYCVYGNWDHKLDYDKPLSRNWVLLQNKIHEVDGFYISGFSGCPTNWGKNPINHEMVADVRLRHSAVWLDLQKCISVAADAVAAARGCP